MNNQELLKQAKQLFKQANQTMDQGIMFLSEFMEVNKGETCNHLYRVKVQGSDYSTCNDCGKVFESDEPKQSKLELMKEKLASGDYVCYYLATANKGNWYKQGGTFNPIEGNTYKLIHKDHAHIAEHIVNKGKANWRGKDNRSSGWTDCNDFFYRYNEDAIYEIIKSEFCVCTPPICLCNKPEQPTKDLSGYRIEDTRDNIKEVKKLISDRKDVIIKIENHGDNAECFFMTVEDSNKIAHDLSNVIFKQAYLHNHELVFEEPKEDGCDFCNELMTVTLLIRNHGYKFCPHCSKPLVAPIEKEQRCLK